MSSLSPKPIQRPWSFSLRQLFVATFTVAFFIFLCRVIPEPLFRLTLLMVLGALLCFVAVAGMAASRANLIFPFLESIGAWFFVWAILFEYGPAQFWNDADVVFGTVSLCLSLVFAISAIRRGLWSTKIVALPAMLMLLLILWSLASFAAKARVLLDWEYVLKYWLYGDYSIL